MKRIISLLLVFALLLPCMGLKAEAATSGTCGENLTWNFDEETGTLTISGTGPMNNFSYGSKITSKSPPWSHVRRKILWLEIANGVTSLGNNAFQYCRKLTSVTIPNSVTAIGDGSFCGAGLTSVTVPDSVTSIDRSAFASCTNLKSVALPEGITSIEFAVFYNCPKLTSVTIPDSVTFIGEAAFEHGRSLTSMTIPDGVTTIYYRTFSECSSLTSITIPDSVTTIEGSSFNGCNSLRDVYYGGSPAQRDAIHIGSNNTPLAKATWYCGKEDKLSPPAVQVATKAATGTPRLSWDAVDGADFYRIYRKESSSRTFSYLKSTRSAAFTDTTAQTGTNYYYQVKAVLEETGETSRFSNTVNRCCDLPRPVIFTTVNGVTGKPMLTWDAIEGAQCYRIYRRTSSTDFIYLDSTSSTTFTDKTAEAGINYYYQVKAVHKNSAANSAPSLSANRACDLPRPVVTVGLKNGNPQITWEMISGAEKYRVYRADSKTGEYELVKSTITANRFTDTGAEAGKTYYYKVRALHSNHAANSAWSAVKSVTAK